jgi:hypothetical protein
MAKAAIVHGERGRRIERQLVAQILGDCLVVAPALLEGEVLLGIDLRTADPERGKAALRMAGHTDAVGIDRLAPDGIVEKVGDDQGDVDRTLPQLVGEVGDRGVIGVGPVVIGRGDDIAMRGKRLCEPGILQRVRAAPMRQHDQRTFFVGLSERGVFVEFEIDEVRQSIRRRCVVDRGRIEHDHSQLAVAVMAVGELDLLDADLVGLDASGRRWREKYADQEREKDRGRARRHGPHHGASACHCHGAPDHHRFRR